MAREIISAMSTAVPGLAEEMPGHAEVDNISAKKSKDAGKKCSGINRIEDDEIVQNVLWRLEHA